MNALPPRKPVPLTGRTETPAKPYRPDEAAWLAENAEAITYQNRLVEDEGAFGDDLRSF
ncbi:type II toxin-antitoxin system CcdA family antitoxin [Azospirillum sp. sgz302134]